MPYCENCGAQVSVNAKFCGNCGTARNQVTINKQPLITQPKPKLSYYSPPTTPLPSSPLPPVLFQAPAAQAPPRMQPATVSFPQASSESVIGVILLRKPRSLGRYDTYTGVVTNQRLILAQMTSQMITAAVEQARAQAKSEGRGFFGQWSDQLRASLNHSKRYLSMPTSAILAETPGNFAINNDAIREINVKLKRLNQQNNVHELEVEIHSNMGTYEYRMDENSDFVNLLKRVYGDRVKMPFGYFSHSVNINL